MYLNVGDTVDYVENNRKKYELEYLKTITKGVALFRIIKSKNNVDNGKIVKIIGNRKVRIHNPYIKCGQIDVRLKNPKHKIGDLIILVSADGVNLGQIIVVSINRKNNDIYYTTKSYSLPNKYSNYAKSINESNIVEDGGKLYYTDKHIMINKEKPISYPHHNNVTQTIIKEKTMPVNVPVQTTHKDGFVNSLFSTMNKQLVIQLASNVILMAGVVVFSYIINKKVYGR